MKTTLLGVLALVSICTAASLPQTLELLAGPLPAQGPAQAQPDLTRNLGLTSAQQKKVAAIQQKQRQQLEAFRRKNPNASGEQLLQQMRSADSAADARLKGVFSATQYQQYQANKQALMSQNGTAPPAASPTERAGTRPTTGRADGGPDQMLRQLTAGLDLTADQQPQVDAIQQKQGQQMEALRSSGDRSRMMSEMRRLDDEADAQYKQVLTAEQYAKLQANKQNLMRNMRPPGQ